MRLFELADTPYPYQKIPHPLMGNDAYEFITSTGLKYYVMFHIYADTTIDIEFEAGEHQNGSKIGITGTGDQFKIFSTIKFIVANYFNSLDLNKFKFISFSAIEPSRIKLYDKFIPIIQKMLGPSWEFKVKNADYRIYMFVNKDFEGAQ